MKYSYEAPVLAARMSLPSWSEMCSGGYLQHVRQAPVSARAGGYTEHYACMRALHEFMAGHILDSDKQPTVQRRSPNPC